MQQQQKNGISGGWPHFSKVSIENFIDLIDHYFVSGLKNSREAGLYLVL